MSFRGAMSGVQVIAALLAIAMVSAFDAPALSELSMDPLLFTAPSESFGSDLEWTSKNASLPKVLVLFTGGTISSGSPYGRLDTTQYGGYATRTGEEIIAQVPEVLEVAQLAVKNFTMENETTGSWDPLALSMAKYTHNALCSADSDIDGAIMIHGTNSLEESLFLLDLTVNCHKPVVAVGSMRPWSAMSFDGDMNLYEAVALAASPDARDRGTMIAFNDRIVPGYWATKTNANTLDTFKALEQGYLGTFVNGHPAFYNTPSQPVNKHTFDVTTIDELPQVDILFVARGFNAELIFSAVKHGAQGVVLAGVGNGMLLPIGEEKVTEAVKMGIPIVVGSRTVTGAATPKLDLLHGISSGYLGVIASRIQLQLCLASGYDYAQTRNVFEGHLRRVIGQEL